MLIGNAVIAGVLSVLSPCVLPLLPGVMAYSTEKNKITPVAIVFGLAVSYTAMGLAAATIGGFLFDYMDIIKVISGLMIIIMGMYLLFEVVEKLFIRLWSRLPVSCIQLPRAEEGGLLGGALLGASLGILWIPCVGSFLGTVILGALQETTMWGGVLLFAYSMGLGLPMLLVAYSSSMISDKLRSISRFTIVIRKIAGAILMFVGIYYLAGVLGFWLPF